mmetsp:Transcript_14160/g.44579  ORF Transcript_14160/g.44579 Transcript_14160/m.44579 type:complete len:243 (-) Transcript_14160:69-797(-)
MDASATASCRDRHSGSSSGLAPNGRCLAAPSRPCPGAGTDRPTLSVAVSEVPTTAWMGSPCSSANAAVVTICTPAPCASMKPERDAVMGRLISFGWRPSFASSTADDVAFNAPNSRLPSSRKSSCAPEMTSRARLDRSSSTARSSDCAAVAQAPTGAVMGPDAESRSMLTQAPMVLMKDSCSVSGGMSTPRNRSRYIAWVDRMPPTPPPIVLPTSETCSHCHSSYGSVMPAVAKASMVATRV